MTVSHQIKRSSAITFETEDIVLLLSLFSPDSFYLFPPDIFLLLLPKVFLYKLPAAVD